MKNESKHNDDTPIKSRPEPEKLTYSRPEPERTHVEIRTRGEPERTTPPPTLPDDH